LFGIGVLHFRSAGQRQRQRNGFIFLLLCASPTIPPTNAIVSAFSPPDMGHASRWLEDELCPDEINRIESTLKTGQGRREKAAGRCGHGFAAAHSFRASGIRGNRNKTPQQDGFDKLAIVGNY
jgi:hypothetical protein